ncbi:MAG: thiamine pyrophosphate-binding protein [Chloroflexi bacterium]|nr:thiamine pyrophosphate-binding protein [Chloroflexota bacterium]
MAVMSGGEALVASLVREGVEVVFGIPGIHMSGIVAALRDEPSIRLITTRHEQGATHMADGYARVSGKPGVVLLVPGAGLYNAASAFATAYARSSPILAIVGQIPRAQIGKGIGAVHEVLDQAEVVRPVTKWRRHVLRPREAPDAVTEAFRQMRTGRPRPVLIEMSPETGVEREDVVLREPAPVSHIVPSADDLRRAVRVMMDSRLPIIYSGGGVAQSNAEGALVRLAEATNIPVVTSSGGKGTIPDDHPFSYGSCFGPRAEMDEMNQIYEVLASADVVIGIGARFSMGNPAGETSTLININIDDSELTRVQSNTIPLHGDAGATIEALLPLLAEAGAADRPSPEEAVEVTKRLIAYYDIRDTEPQYPIMEMMWNTLPEETVIAWDVTQFGYYARSHYRVNRPKTYIDSGYSFNLGYAFPTAMGIKEARPDVPVLCVSGDGGFMFNAVELATAVQYGINIVTVVFRDDSYGNVARDLDTYFGGTYGTELKNPDLVKFAESFGAVGIRAKSPEDLETLLLEALSLNAPVVIDVPLTDLSLPRAKMFRGQMQPPWTMPQEGLLDT